MEDLDSLIQQAKALGMPSPSLYLLLPPDQRIDALKRDIKKAKQSTPADE